MKQRRGVTLMETVVAVGVSGSLLIGLGSAVVIASSSLPGRDSETGELLESARALDRVTGDLAQATRFWKDSNGAWRATVPDRDGDDEHDPVRYDWDGKGDPIERTPAGGAAETIMPVVEALTLGLKRESYTLDLADPIPIWSDADVVGYRDDTGKNLGDYEMPGERVMLVPLEMSFPGDADFWRPRALSVMVTTSSETTKGSLSIHQYNADRSAISVALFRGDFDIEDGLAGHSNLSQDNTDGLLSGILAGIGVDLDEDDQDVWVAVEVDTNLELDPDGAYVLAVWSSDSDDELEFPLRQVSGRQVFAARRSGEKIDTSSMLMGNDMVVPYSVSGESRTMSPPMTQDWSSIRSAEITVQTPQGKMSREVGMVNEPDVLEFVAHAEFSGPPTGSDANADGAGDWVRQDAGAFDEDSITGGVWDFDTTIQTGFAETSGPLHSEIRWRAPKSKLLSFTLPSDHDGSEHIRCVLTLERENANRQLLTLWAFGDGTRVELDSATVEHGELIDVALRVDPDNDIAMLSVDGLDRAPVRVPRTLYNTNNTRFILNPGSGSGEVDRVLVKVGTP